MIPNSLWLISRNCESFLIPLYCCCFVIMVVSLARNLFFLVEFCAFDRQFCKFSNRWLYSLKFSEPHSGLLMRSRDQIVSWQEEDDAVTIPQVNISPWIFNRSAYILAVGSPTQVHSSANLTRLCASPATRGPLRGERRVIFSFSFRQGFIADFFCIFALCFDDFTSVISCH